MADITLDKIAEYVKICKRCGLSATRTHAVPGEGFPTAKLMCIGEGPGFHEDQQGRPFVGESGHLLDKILAVSGFSRQTNTFIANIVKCRPPSNRDPLPEERQACLPLLLKQIEIVNPTIIVLLGATALKGLIDPEARITRLRGKWMEWQGRMVMPTYHPSALLRNPELKRPVWEDFKLVIDKYRELVDPNHHSDYH
ncbi:MAG: uracil-DNA glycosylase [Bacteroidaceae bacterium]|nr:uracil-DNA glycosylase [Bacteroidaceae bacterium]